MNERLVVRNYPDEGTLGASGEAVGRVEMGESEIENAREHFDFRLTFAERVSRAKSLELHLAIRRYTDIYHRLGIYGREALLPESILNIRRQYDDGVEERKNDHKQLIEWTTQFYVNRVNRHDIADTFFPFGYVFDPSSGAVVMMFGSTRFDFVEMDQPGLLSSARFEEQKAKLVEMFKEIKKLHPDATRVEGSSWLHAREEYRRLFPPEYYQHSVPSRLPDGQTFAVNFWGQFIDKNGRVRKRVAEQLLKNAAHLNPDDIAAVFPTRPLDVECDIQYFYKFYGIE